MRNGPYELSGPLGEVVWVGIIGLKLTHTIYYANDGELIQMVV